MNKKFGLILEKWAEKAKVRVTEILKQKVTQLPGISVCSFLFLSGIINRNEHILRGNREIFGEKSRLCRKRVKSERFRGLFLGPFGLKSEEKLE